MNQPIRLYNLPIVRAIRVKFTPRSRAKDFRIVISFGIFGKIDAINFFFANT